MARRLRAAVLCAIASLLVAPAAFAAEGSHAGDEVAEVGLRLAIVLVAAKVGGEIAMRLRQAPVLGELVAGIVLGNVPWLGMRGLGADPAIDMLARLGVLLLLFEVGLESTVREVLEAGASAAKVASLGTLATFVAGFAAAWALAPSAGTMQHVFLGASVTATSIGITARVFKDLGRTRTLEARTILGAAVLDDIIALVVLALVGGMIARAAHGGGGGAALSLLVIVLKTLGFLAVALFVGLRVTPRVFAYAARFRIGGVLLAAGLSFCFVLAYAADALGLAPIVGSFAAGLVLEELHFARFIARGERTLTQLMEPITDFLVPIFFVLMGLRADVSVFFEGGTLALAGGLLAAAVVGKLACGLGAARGVDRLTVAFGMMPRGDVSLIFANLVP